MAHYLVTGGCGFIGSHLVDALERQGHEVRVLDDLSSGKRRNVSLVTKVIIGSVTDPETVRRAVEDVDGVFHLAAIPSVERSRAEWRATHATNMTGTINVLDAVRLSGAAVPVVYASSAAVYGDVDRTPIKETATTTRPLSAYGADKLGSELHAHVAAVVHGVATTGLRFFNVYGPRQDPKSPYSGVISIFCDKLRCNETVEVYGDGDQVRDFVYVEDVVRFLLKSMETTRAGARVLNVCTGIATSVKALAETVSVLCRVNPKIRFLPARPGDIRVSVGCPWLTADTLGMKAEIGIREGLRRTLASLSNETPRNGVEPRARQQAGQSARP